MAVEVVGRAGVHIYCGELCGPFHTSFFSLHCEKKKKKKVVILIPR